MVSFVKSVTFDCEDALVVAEFWATALASTVDEDSTRDRAWVEPAGVRASGSGACLNRSSPRTGSTSTCVPSERYWTRWSGSWDAAPRSDLGATTTYS